MTASRAALLARCTFPPTGAPLTCAVSGGPDSLALLVLARTAGCAVTAVHVDHGLRPESAGEAQIVAAAARTVGATFRAERALVEPGPNLEARARRARYAVLPPDVATGHTADDQAETVLLAMLRGSGWDGLGGMDPGPTRPILGLRRTETVSVCAAAGLEPFDDPSNRDPRHRRNRVRAELLPLLAAIAERDPVPILCRQADLLRDGAFVLDRVSAGLDPTHGPSLVAAPPALARLAVRHWLWDAWRAVDTNAPPPDLACVDRVLAVAAERAVAADLHAGWRVRRHHQRLSLHPPQQ